MPLEKLKITPDAGEAVTAMYNPAQFTIESRNQFQRSKIPGLPVPVTQFVSGEAEKITLKLFFDTYEAQTDVRTLTSKVLKLMKIEPNLHRPPVCTFSWGGTISGDQITDFNGVIDSLSQNFTMFLDDGTPVRATLTLGITEYRTINEQLTMLKLRSADHTKVRVIKEGQRLWHLANTEYGDPAEWRVIADENGIDNPRLIEPGTSLSLPPLE